MSDSRSPTKRAMDEKLATVWPRKDVASASPASSKFSAKLPSERIEELKAEQDAALERVFRPLASG